MTTDTQSALHPKASVTVDAAANLVQVDAETIRRWSKDGTIEIELRGDMEVVRLDQVRHAAATRRERRGSNRAALRARLDGATVDDLSVVDLQELARGRVAAGGR
jgi:predicted site-specific integrase-resolvase